MTTEASATPVPPIPAGNETNPRDVFEPMEGDPTLINTFDTLLKKPGAVLHDLHKGDSRRLLKNLSITTFVSLAVFGVMIGFFSGGNQLWAVPMKVVIGVFASGLITLPSLYIFSCLNGLDVNAKTVAGVMAAALCLTSLLLLGLSPVAWIFSQSSESLVFMGFLALSFWVIGLWLGLGLIFRAAKMLGVNRRGHLLVWAAIFVVVTFQMSTTLRPIVGDSEGQPLFTGEKKFFLSHWFENMNGEGGPDYKEEGWR
jgi:hypothetical protein